MTAPIEGRDYVDFEETGERRLPVAASVAALPKTTEVELPVTCWVRNTGMYVMETMGEWKLLRALEPPTDVHDVPITYCETKSLDQGIKALLRARSATHAISALDAAAMMDTDPVTPDRHPTED